MTIPDEAALPWLASNQRAEFLAELVWWLVLAGRSDYPGAGAAIEQSQKALECLNELQHVVAAQLRSSLRGGTPAYPDDAFLDVLAERASSRGCGVGWATTLRGAVGELARRHPGVR